MAATFDDDADLEAWADRPPSGAWFSLAGTADPAALCPEAFAQGGAVDGLAPDGLLAALAEGVFVPATLLGISGNALLGVVAASQRLAARAAAMTQQAVAEYARRSRTADRKQATRAGYREFSPDDLAPELVVNATQAEAIMLRHESSQRRLPACSQALWDGKLGEYCMKIIADGTACLDEDGATEADQILALAAPGRTSGQLRALVARIVLMIDPDAAEQRRKDAAARARVVKYREEAGTAALSGRDLPPEAVERSWQHIGAGVSALQASGVKAGVDKLRSAVYLGLTSGTDPLAVLPLLQDSPGDRLTPDASTRDGRDGDDGRDGGQDDQDDQDGEGGEGGSRRDGPGSGPAGPAGLSGPKGGDVAPFQATINLLVPVGTAFGWSSAPGDIPGFGPLDPEATREMMAAASRHPGTRWCVTLVSEQDGTAVAHGCAPGQHPWAPPRAGPGPARDPGEAADPGQQAAEFLASLRVNLAPVAKDACEHAGCTDKYEVPRKLKHLIWARNATCTAPCCNRAAAGTDADHTIPWPDGLTCQANLGPTCRRHHRAKQAPGWLLDQPAPGTFHWKGPSGRVRTTYPTRYLL